MPKDKSACGATATTKLHCAIFPAASIALNVLVVFPTGNKLPLARPVICVVTTPGQLSVPVGAAYVTIAPQTFVSLDTVMSEGHVITGVSKSITVTVKVQLLVLP